MNASDVFILFFISLAAIVFVESYHARKYHSGQEVTPTHGTVSKNEVVICKPNGVDWLIFKEPGSKYPLDYNCVVYPKSIIVEFSRSVT